MTASLPSDAAPNQPLELKGTTLPVTAIMVGQADAPNLQLALAGKLGEAPGFFEGELALLDLTRLPADLAESVQLDRLIALLRQAGMIPVAARGLSGSMAAVAEALGLAVLPAAPAARERLQAAHGAPAAAALRPAASRPDGLAQPAAAAQPVPDEPALPARAGAATAPQTAATRPAAAPAPEAPASPDDAPDTVTALVVERPLRSGQRIYARGRDLVLLSGVSPGAEVIADGSIHCYGKLRGRALAGASGNAAARIFAQDFQAELVSIAGVWRNFEPTDVRIRGGEPVRVSLRDDGTTQAIAIEPITAD